MNNDASQDNTVYRLFVVNSVQTDRRRIETPTHIVIIMGQSQEEVVKQYMI